VSVLPPEGGWSAVLRFPAIVDEETLVVELLRAGAVAIHPGYFFDLPRDGYLVASLLPPHDAFVEGIERVLARIDRYIDGPSR
jgi:aspartate/methionine/tyrosine aminotransferase